MFIVFCYFRANTQNLMKIVKSRQDCDGDAKHSGLGQGYSFTIYHFILFGFWNHMICILNPFKSKDRELKHF